MRLKTIFAALILGVAVSLEAQVTMNIDANKRGPMISPYQYGLFFEEINHAGDGGLYGELVRNRSFEEGTDFWARTKGATLSLTTTGLMNSAQGHALDLYTSKATHGTMRGAKNEGFWGMKFEKDSTYTLTLWAKANDEGYTGTLAAQLLKSDGATVIGEAKIEGDVYTDKWNKLTATIKATDTDLSGQLLLLTSNSGHLYLDMVSLFPYTWKGRPNGLRPDLAQLLADTKPSFLRFPGGCYVEGQDSWEKTFQWKKTIGPIEQRPGHMNQNWGYRSSDGLGFDEYLQLCEDLGAAPMFVVNVGLGHGYHIPMEDLDTLVQNTLDAIEYANGDGSTTYGALRIKNGHVAPYNLKFIEIGNENYNFTLDNNNDQSFEYPQRYYKFYKAIKEKYPEIVTIGNVEAWGTDDPSWRNTYPVEMVDEHYYRSHSWMRDNYTKYDNYARDVPVYNGEYAANAGGTYGKYGNMNSALGEAIYMMGLERNSDVCQLASFAPIFTHESNPVWPYDMIHFNSGSNFVTPSYYVQKLMNTHLGKQNLVWTENGNRISGNSSCQVGLATWDTQATFDDVNVSTAASTIISDDFSGSTGWQNQSGAWVTTGGVKKQTANGQPCRTINSTIINSDSYIYKVRAKKDGGAEGFLIVFDYQDENNYTWWNIGGWNNTQHAIEVCTNGSKTTISPVAGSVNEGQWYDLRIEVSQDRVNCYIDNQLIHSYSKNVSRALFQSCQLDEEKGEMILKVANPFGQEQVLTVNGQNMTFGSASVIRLASANGTDENTMDNPFNVKPSGEESVSTEPQQLILTIPPYSLNIYHVAVSNIGQEVTPTTVKYPEYEKEDEGMSAYLFSHMSSQGEWTSYALSKDGKIWNDLANGAEAMDTKAMSTTGGMRDSYVTRMQNGQFIMVATDMTSALGWNSNHIMDLMISSDLIHWTKEVKIDLETEENLAALSKVYGSTMTESMMTAAWAPEVIYDKETGKYVLYYSVGFPDRHRIFYQLIDEELNILTEPRLYFDPGYDIIDADIVWNAPSQQYVMVFKCEKTSGFDRATAKSLVPAEGATGTTVWSVTDGWHVGDNGQAIEAITMWRPLGGNLWKLAYQNYSGGTYYGYKMRNMDENCDVFSSPYYMEGNVNAQHGSIMKLTQEEYDYLQCWSDVKITLEEVKKFYETSKDETCAAAIAKAEQALTVNAGTKAENISAMSAALAALLEAKKLIPQDMKAWLLEQARNGKPTVLTSLLVNADFSNGRSGWSSNTSFTAANNFVAEFYNKNFDFWQTVGDLPNGEYEVGVQAFYRNGGKAAYYKYITGLEDLNAHFYANNVNVPVVSLYSEKGYTGDPYNFPDGVGDANTAFNVKNQYHNKLKVIVTDGKLTLGINKTVETGEDWCCFDNFTLKFLTPSTGISTTTAEIKADNALYDLQGRKLKNAPNGIYIQNGRKIIK